MQTKLTREDAIELLRKHNKEPFHILHGLTVTDLMSCHQTAHANCHFID